MGVWPGRTPLARPRRPGDGGCAGRWPPRAAGLRREELAGLAGISVDLPDPAGAGTGYLAVVAGRGGLSPGRCGCRTPSGSCSSGSRARPRRRDVVPTRITPSVQRLLDRLSHTPVAVHDAAHNLIVANQPYDALMGATTSWRGIERNGVWRNLVGPGNRTVHTPEEQARFESLLVADLRMTAARYPADRELKRLIAELASHSPRFVELWDSGEVGSPQDRSRHKIIDHPDVGLITLDCDALIVAGDDLRITVYTAEPGTEDAERLALAVVLGTQSLID